MRTYEAVALGVLQGATEFLPVSSSGHLVLAGKLFGVTEPSVLVATSLHLGTLAAVVWFTRRELGGLARGLRQGGGSRTLLMALILGSIPAAVVGLALLPRAESLFDSSVVAGVGLIVTSVLLWHSRGMGPGCKKAPGVVDALLVGTAQAAALVPGISRSGSTIWAGMGRGVSRPEAARYSFLLSIPATAAAALAELSRPVAGMGRDTGALVLGATVAAVVGWVALRVLYHLVTRGKLWVFAPYCFGVGVTTLVVSSG